MPWSREVRAITPAIRVKSVFIVEVERSFDFSTFSPQFEGPQSN